MSALANGAEPQARDVVEYILALRPRLFERGIDESVSRALLDPVVKVGN